MEGNAQVIQRDTASNAGRLLERIDVSNLAEPLRSTMRARLAPFEGQPLSKDLADKIRHAVVEVEPLAGLLWRRNQETGNSSLTVMLGGLPLTSRPAAESGFPTPGEVRLSVRGSVQAGKLRESKLPVYPPLALQARIQGTVRFGALIDKEGRVADLFSVTGHPVLVSAAQEAVKQYVYQPTLINGKPVEVVTQIDVNFTLATMPVL